MNTRTETPLSRRAWLARSAAFVATAAVSRTALRPATPAASSAGLNFTCHTSGEAAAQSNSWLVSGDRDAFLFDVVQMRHEAEQVVEMIQRSGLRLRFIWISHAHPDHFLGLDVVTAAFPEVPVWSTAEVAADIAAGGPGLVRILAERWGADGPRQLVVPRAFDGNCLDLEGERIDIRTFAGAESRNLAALVLPGTRQMLTADIVYNRTHLFLREKNLTGWLEQLTALEEYAGRAIDALYPGHGHARGLELIPGTRRYLESFRQALALGSAAAVRERMLAEFPDYAVPRLLTDYTLPAFFPEAAKPAPRS